MALAALSRWITVMELALRVDCAREARRERGLPAWDVAVIRVPSRPVAPRRALHRGAFILCATIAALWLHASVPISVMASTLIVPDNTTRLQAAIDAGPDTVLIRPGSYPEVATIRDGIVLRALVLSETGEWPEVDGLLLDYTFHPPSSRPVVAEGLAFRGPVRVINESTWNEIEFTACRMESGIAVSGLDTGYLRVRRCEITGMAQLSARVVIADSNNVNGSMSIQMDGLAQIRGNALVGSSGIAIFGMGRSAGSYEISDNTITGFDRGIEVEREYDIDVSNNHIERCAGLAMRLQAFSTVTVSNNSVIDCFGGLELRGGTVVAIENRVIGATTSGIRVLGDASPGVMRGNVTGRCGGDGITMPEVRSASVEGNTCYLNGGHGISMTSAETGTVMANIGYRNGGAGASIGFELEPRCNDWFENARGSVEGPPPSAEDVALDPLFCDVTHDDVHLSFGSPLLSLTRCDTIGALGMGCDVPTSTRLTRFTAGEVASGIEVRWQVTHAADALLVWLERANSEGGPWSRVDSDRRNEGEVVVELDRDVVSGKHYWYQLLAEESGRTLVLGSPIEVAMSTASFTLTVTGSNPSPGPVQLEFALATPAAIALEVFDPQGRRVATLAGGMWPAGVHRASWADAGRARAGLYLLRYRHPAGEAQRRIVLVR